MPLRWASEFYWPGDGAVPEPPASVTGYAGWQGAIVAALVVLSILTPGFYGLAAVPLFASSFSLRGWIWSKVNVKWRLLWHVYQLVNSDGFTLAETAVAEVATTPGMREKRTWGEIGNRVGKIPGVGENVFRHLRATELYPVPFRQMQRRNLLLELALYQRREKLHRVEAPMSPRS